MNTHSLNGLTVLNTRPRQQQHRLNEAIVAHGGNVISLPMLRIDPVTEGTDLERIRSRIEKIPGDHGIVFISANAAVIGASLIKEALPELPSSLEIFAVGPSTARVLQEALMGEVTQPVSGTTSEDLLALPQLQQLSQRSLLIVRGRGGRETLRQTLEERGARVEYLEVYTRRPEDITPYEFARRLETGQVNAVVVTSGESLQRLLDLAADNKDRLTLLPLIVPSARIGKLAGHAGFTHVVESAGAGEAAVVAALSRVAGGNA